MLLRSQHEGATTNLRGTKLARRSATSQPPIEASGLLSRYLPLFKRADRDAAATLALCGRAAIELEPELGRLVNGRRVYGKRREGPTQRDERILRRTSGWPLKWAAQLEDVAPAVMARLRREAGRNPDTGEQD